MLTDDSDQKIPTWLFVLIGVGLCAPLCLVLAMVMRPSPPTAAERKVAQQVAQQVAEREAAVSQQREKDVAQERVAAQQALRDLKSRAALFFEQHVIFWLINIFVAVVIGFIFFLLANLQQWSEGNGHQKSTSIGGWIVNDHPFASVYATVAWWIFFLVFWRSWNDEIEFKRQNSLKGEEWRMLHAPKITVAVVKVWDGDTVNVMRGDSVTLKVRLHGIDAPELGQPFGEESRKRLAELVMPFGEEAGSDRLADLAMRGNVAICEHGKDKFGRTLVWLEVGGRDVASKMLADGLAWHNVEYDHSQTLAEAEQSARAAKRGLWADAKALPPWEWRVSEHERKRQPSAQ